VQEACDGLYPKSELASIVESTPLAPRVDLSLLAAMVDFRLLSLDIYLNIFFITLSKILIRKNLGTRGIVVLGKILSRKDLRVKYYGIRS